MGEDIDQGRRTFLGLATGAAVGGALGAAAAPPAATAFALSETLAMSGGELSRAIQARRISCVEVLREYLKHIERCNPKVNALVALEDPDELLGQALERDTQLARGQTLGVLHGIPHAVKDLQPVAGLRFTQGSPLFKDFVAQNDSLMVARLRAAGAIFIGKTNTPEFGLGSNTYNAVYGITRNAYDPARSAGGSSGGAAVALALRMLPFADGSDYGGSLRNPAGWNNVVGFRTSIGRTPNDARDVWLPSMSVVGPMARSVTDAALLLSVQAGYDARAPLSIEGEGTAFRRVPEGALKGRRIAFGADLSGHAPCEPGVLEVCRAALRTFSALGCHVEEAHPDYDLEAVWQALIKLRGWQTGSNLLGYYNDPAKRAQLKPEALYEIETGLKLSAYDITAASVVRSEWYEATRRFFERYDFLILPTAQMFPFPAEEHWPQRLAGRQMRTYHEWMKGTLLITMTGSPSLAVPAGFSREGLPMGLQIIAANRRELDCLALGHAYEEASDWVRLRPPPLVKLPVST